MSFEHPWLLLGTLGAVIPIAIHLINRQRAPIIRFAALEHLLLSDRRLAQRLKLRQLVVLLLRVGLILALALALAWPTSAQESPAETHTETAAEPTAEPIANTPPAPVAAAAVASTASPDEASTDSIFDKVLIQLNWGDDNLLLGSGETRENSPD
ncbi:MAG: BatA domain-containing protein, partial [Myxococcota bacterium]|nr:BatA domain-containing protein [Myxococcota bacterium]